MSPQKEVLTMNLYTIYDENRISQSSVEDMKIPCLLFSWNLKYKNTFG